MRGGREEGEKEEKESKGEGVKEGRKNSLSNHRRGVCETLTE